MVALDMVRLLESVEKIQKVMSYRNASHCTSGIYVFFYGEDLVALGLDGRTFFWQKVPYAERFAAEFPHECAALIDYSQYTPLLKMFKSAKKADVVCVTPTGDGEYSELVFTLGVGTDSVSVPVTFVEESNFESVKSLYRRMVCREYTQAELVTKEWALDTTGGSYAYPSMLLLVGQFFDRKIKRNDPENPINTTAWMITYKTREKISEALYHNFTAQESMYGCVAMNVRVEN